MRAIRLMIPLRTIAARPRRAARAGLSLLEVIVALAVLAGSAAVIAQMVEMAVRRSIRSEERTEAATLCHNLMNELVAGVRPWQNMTSAQPVDLFSPWDYQVTVEPLGFADLAAVTVIVSRREGATEGGMAAADGAAGAALSPPPAPQRADATDGPGMIAARDSRPTYRWSRWVRATLPSPGRDTQPPNADGAMQSPGGLDAAPPSWPADPE